MDQEQIEKQLEWLDKERRGDKQVIASLQKRVAELEGLLEKNNSFISNVESEVTQVAAQLTRIDSFDEALNVHRKEIKKEIESIEKKAKAREKTTRENAEAGISKVSQQILNFEKGLTPIPGLRVDIDKNKLEDQKLARSIEELRKSIKERADEHALALQTITLMEADQSGNKKQFADLKGETSALRKQIDELRGQQQVITEGQKKIDVRINELMASEAERREKQMEFIEKISIAQLNVEKAFQEWTTRFDDIEKRAETLTDALQTYRGIERSLTNAQKEFEDITEKIDRRIHEITEMQRLGEERFRQEWTTFKSDDQKRWVNYTITQEETSKEVNRRLERLGERATSQEEILQDLQDGMQHTSEQLESIIQNLLGVFRDWLTTNERLTENM